MLENVQQLLKRYHAFYEGSPYHVVVEEGHGSAAVTRRIVQAGFDVDIHAVSNKNELELPPPGEYAFGYAELKKIADAVSYQAKESFIEVIYSQQRSSLRHVSSSDRKQWCESELHIVEASISRPAYRKNAR